MDPEDADFPSEELTSRAPQEKDLVALCARLNELKARYLIVGGFAMIQAGLPRFTGDVDVLIDASLDNEALVYQSLEIFPDKAVLELKPGEVSQYNVIRVADEIVIDLMESACGIDYGEASKDMVIREVQGVSIPFASPRMLWRMKYPLKRAKDQGDLAFLCEYFKARGEEPPVC